jgi:hypothetical protein
MVVQAQQRMAMAWQVCSGCHSRHQPVSAALRRHHLGVTDLVFVQAAEQHPSSVQSVLLCSTRGVHRNLHNLATRICFTSPNQIDISTTAASAARRPQHRKPPSRHNYLGRFCPLWRVLPAGLWNFNALAAGTILQDSDGTTVIKRGSIPCALAPDPTTGAPVCTDVWVSGAGGAAVPAFAPGRYGQGLNIASGVLNWGEWGGVLCL